MRERTSKPRIFYGWWIILLSFAGMILGPPLTVFSFGVFFPFFVREFHASRTAISFAFTLHNFLGALWLPFVGTFIDRFGARRVILFTTSGFALTLLTAMLLRGTLAPFYLFYAVLGCTMPTPQGYGTVVARWFNRKRGLAFGVSGLSVGLGSFVVPLLSRHLITKVGWRATYFIYGTGILLVAVPLLARFLRNSPAELGLLPDGDPAPLQSVPQADPVEGLTWREACGTRAFWLMLGVFVLTSASVHAGILHMPSLMADRGATPGRAALAGSLIGIAILLGRVVSGYLLDHIFAPYVGMAFYAAASLGFGLLWAGSAGSFAFVAAFLVGLGMGAEVDMMAYLTTRYFGLRAFATIYGITFAAFMIAGALGPLVMAAGYDRFHSYKLPLGLFSVALLCAVGLLARLGPYRYGIQRDSEASPVALASAAEA